MASITIGYACHHRVTNDSAGDTITVLAALRVPLDADAEVIVGGTIDFSTTFHADERVLMTMSHSLVITDPALFEETSNNATSSVRALVTVFLLASSSDFPSTFVAL